MRILSDRPFHPPWVGAGRSAIGCERLLPSFKDFRVLRRSALALCFALAVGAAACGGNDNNNPNLPSAPPPQGPPNLVIEDLTVGTGTEGTAGKLFSVN